MKRGFTLLEMLIVIGIIAILTSVSVTAYSHLVRAGENARAHELVVQVATALTALFDSDGVWPEKIRKAKNASQGGGKLLDEEAAYCLNGRLSMTVDSTTEKATGNDKFGIVTPWATTVIKRLGTEAKLESKVSGSSQVQDHILHFAVDLDGDGVIKDVVVGGSTISVRATAIVWCCNKDGEILDYETGKKKDGLYSWSSGQTVKVE